MTATERDQRRRAAQRLPWWKRTKAQQKADIETAVREFLNLDRELSDREMYFLTEALAAVARGTFGIALQAILDAHTPESYFSPKAKIPPDDFKGFTIEALRAALSHSEDCPAREFPLFG